jgi:hypothetical protein
VTENATIERDKAHTDPTHPDLVEADMAVGLAAPMDKLAVFTHQAKRVGILMRCDPPPPGGAIDEQQAVDRFWLVWEQSGLLEWHGADVFDDIMQRAIERRPPPIPYVNGHAVVDDGHVQAGAAGSDAVVDIGPEPPPADPADHGAVMEPTSGSPRFIPVALDDVATAAEPAWLINRLLPARGLACVVGAPKCGKSFLTTDMLGSVARGVPYAGRDTLQGPVIYLTGEGVSGFKRRLIAMRRHHGIEGQAVPFFMIENVPDLGSERSVDLPALLNELDRFLLEQQIRKPRAIVLDTVARCMGDGDENTAKDMGRFVNRCSAIERHFGCVVVVVHHVGKDPGRGGRGSNALNGAADVTMLVEKVENYTKVRIDEMKDGPEGQEWRFRLIPFEINDLESATCATSESHSETSSCVVEILSEPAYAQPSATKVRRPPAGVEGDLLRVIKRAIDESGEIGIAGRTVPNNARAVERKHLKTYCETMDWQQEGEPNAFRAMLSKTLSKLRSRDLIGFDTQAVWLIGQ